MTSGLIHEGKQDEDKAIFQMYPTLVLYEA